MTFQDCTEVNSRGDWVIADALAWNLAKEKVADKPLWRKPDLEIRWVEFSEDFESYLGAVDVYRDVTVEDFRSVIEKAFASLDAVSSDIPVIVDNSKRESGT